jgi:hypothetical protein
VNLPGVRRVGLRLPVTRSSKRIRRQSTGPLPESPG